MSAENDRAECAEQEETKYNQARTVRKNTRTVRSEDTKIQQNNSARRYCAKATAKTFRKRWNKKICAANLKDYNEWMVTMVTRMKEADKKGDSETIFRIVKIMNGLMTAASSTTPSTDKQGDLILDHKSLTKVCQDFLSGKFKTTDREADRDQRS